MTENVVYTEHTENFKIVPLPVQNVRKWLVTTILDLYRVGPASYERLKKSYTLRLCEHQALGNCHVLVLPGKLISTVAKKKRLGEEDGWNLFEYYVYQQRGRVPDGPLPPAFNEDNITSGAELISSEAPGAAKKTQIIKNWVSTIPEGANPDEIFQDRRERRTDSKYFPRFIYSVLIFAQSQS